MTAGRRRGRPCRSGPPHEDGLRAHARRPARPGRPGDVTGAAADDRGECGSPRPWPRSRTALAAPEVSAAVTHAAIVADQALTWTLGPVRAWRTLGVNCDQAACRSRQNSPPRLRLLRRSRLATVERPLCWAKICSNQGQPRISEGIPEPGLGAAIPARMVAWRSAFWGYRPDDTGFHRFGRPTRLGRAGRPVEDA